MMKLTREILGTPCARPGRWLRDPGTIGWLQMLEPVRPSQVVIRRQRRALTGLEDIIRFVSWAQKQHQFPTPKAIKTRFGVSRATTYRWRNALAAAYGVVPPPCSGEEALTQ